MSEPILAVFSQLFLINVWGIIREGSFSFIGILMILGKMYSGTDMSGQTIQTQIRLSSLIRVFTLSPFYLHGQTTLFIKKKQQQMCPNYFGV